MLSWKGHTNEALKITVSTAQPARILGHARALHLYLKREHPLANGKAAHLTALTGKHVWHIWKNNGKNKSKIGEIWVNDNTSPT